jgi:hypothetical protein
MDDKNEDVFSYLIAEHAQVCLGDVETKVNECTAECIVSFSPCLLEPIKQFPQPLNHILLAFVSWWQLHIDFFTLS